MKSAKIILIGKILKHTFKIRKKVDLSSLSLFTMVCEIIAHCIDIRRNYTDHKNKVLLSHRYAYLYLESKGI
jgi:hypothetical protein